MRSHSLQPSFSMTLAQPLTKSALQAHYSNVPVNVPILYPSDLKDRGKVQGAMKSMSRRQGVFFDMEDTSMKPQHRDKIDFKRIDRTTDLGSVEAIVKIAKQHQTSRNAKKKRGTMSINELWSSKHLKHIIKATNIERMCEDIKQAEQEDLGQKLDKLERIYERRKPSIQQTDSNIFFAKFQKEGLNIPFLQLSSDKLERAQTSRTLPKLGFEGGELTQSTMTDRDRTTTLPDFSRLMTLTNRKPQELRYAATFRSDEPDKTSNIQSLMDVITGADASEKPTPPSQTRSPKPNTNKLRSVASISSLHSYTQGTPWTPPKASKKANQNVRWPAMSLDLKSSAFSSKSHSRSPSINSLCDSKDVTMTQEFVRTERRALTTISTFNPSRILNTMKSSFGSPRGQIVD